MYQYLISSISLILGSQEDKMISVGGSKSVERISQNATTIEVRATLGREATIKCQAGNLVGQKTVCKH